MTCDDDTKAAMSGLDVGLRLLVAVLGGGAVGLAIDQYMQWGPWLMLGLGIAGFVAWLVDVARRKKS